MRTYTGVLPDRPGHPLVVGVAGDLDPLDGLPGAGCVDHLAFAGVDANVTEAAGGAGPALAERDDVAGLALSSGPYFRSCRGEGGYARPTLPH